MKKAVYTYILKDLKLKIYKIGRTSSPHSRFQDLCIRGRIEPIALLKKDIELKLHQDFSDFRIDHPDKIVTSGRTEWFKGGGIFKDFTDKIDTGKSFPIISPHRMSEEWVEDDKIYVDINTRWDMDADVLAYHKLGLTILYKAGYFSIKGPLYTTEKKKRDIFIIDRKISLSEKVMEEILSIYYIKVLSEVSKKASEGNLVGKFSVTSGKGKEDVYVLMIKR